MTDSAAALALPRLLQLVSPALPVGAYAYSGGLEYAVDAGWVGNREQARDWIAGLAEHSLCRLDLPVLRRLYCAWQADDRAQLEYWSAFLAASRESAELLAEDRQLGMALARLLRDLDVPRAQDWLQAATVTWATLFSLAAVHWRIDAPAMQQGYLWAWCENQVAAAIKLVPLGQTAGQQILSWCAQQLPLWVADAADIADDDIGQLAPALAAGSALHETQYSRLFRS